jgi:hypothetical protein
LQGREMQRDAHGKRFELIVVEPDGGAHVSPPV